MSVYITYEEDCPESSKQIRRELKNEEDFKETKSARNADIILCGITSDKVFEMGKRKIKTMMKKLEKQYPDKICVFFVTHISDDDEPLEVCCEASVNNCADFEGLDSLLDKLGFYEEESEEESEEDEEESEEESEEDEEESDYD